HAPVTRGGATVSSLDLVGQHFAVVAARRGADWGEAARRAAHDLGVEVDVLRAGADFEDTRDRWQRASGIWPDGVVLVRPDGFVAFRARATRADAFAELREALARARMSAC